VGFGNVNISGVSTVGLTMELYINGTGVSGDATELTQSHMGVAAVAAGAAVTVTLTGTNSSTSNSPNLTMYVAALFVPSTL
jgi:hypothetical protein